MATAERSQRIDRAIGERIRRRRVALGLTQEQLAAKLGISYQQIQKYERGANRISASRLFELGLRLDVEPSHFFEDLVGAGLDDGAGDHGGRDRAAIEIARNFGRIDDVELRAALAGLVRAVVEPRCDEGTPPTERGS